jgi:hypothetical protein
MNIFYLDSDPVVCAQMHCDKHVVKMILESCQLLSTAHRVLDGHSRIEKSASGRNVKRWYLNDLRQGILYGATHINHPSAIWCRENILHYAWLRELLDALLEEYTHRYEKIHKCETIAKYLMFPPYALGRLVEDFTEPPPAMPDECKVKNDSVLSYRNYYIMHKARFAKWTNREVPIWYAKGIMKKEEKEDADLLVS